MAWREKAAEVEEGEDAGIRYFLIPLCHMILLGMAYLVSQIVKAQCFVAESFDIVVIL